MPSTLEYGGNFELCVAAEVVRRLTEVHVRLREAFHNWRVEVQVCIQREVAVLANMLGEMHHSTH